MLDVPTNAHLALISDLHLDVNMPNTLRAFENFIHQQAQLAKKSAHPQYLFILGDFFEYWAGDDDHIRGINQTIIDTLHQASAIGLRIYIMHGNRDFLLGARFHQAAGTHALPDLVCLQQKKEQYLLLHGDTLCTDDLQYQQYRTMVRSPEWQNAFLAKPLTERLQFIEQLRLRSQQENQYKTNSAQQIMDVNQQAVQHILIGSGCTKMIHGHTHRPAHHAWQYAGQIYERWVLSDWVLDEDNKAPRANALLIAPASPPQVQELQNF